VGNALLADLDESIRQLLIRYVPLDPTAVEVSFEAPDREWSGRLSRPTLNCFLYDLRENHDLRHNDWETSRTNGSHQKRKPFVRIDASYQVSAWARAPEDEHHLLWRALVALVRNPILPEDVLQGALREQSVPLPAKVGQPDQTPRNPADLWQALDNRIRPAVAYVVTLALDPDLQITSPLVFTSFTRLQRLGGEAMREQVQIAGTVRAKDAARTPTGGATVRIKETGDAAVTDAEGRFVFSHAPRGAITLVTQIDGRSEVAQSFDVPAASYDLDV
jgi:hypothetical protein